MHFSLFVCVVVFLIAFFFVIARYTAIPFIRASGRHFFTTQQFLDAIAIGSVVPTPLVMFVDFLGYLIKGVPGSVLITLGMFIPAFSFTVWWVLSDLLFISQQSRLSRSLVIQSLSGLLRSIGSAICSTESQQRLWVSSF